MLATYDSIYKTLFAHPAMIQDLLLGFTALATPESLDFATLSRVNASFVALRGDEEETDAVVRHADMVWRIRLLGEWRYLYLMVEFQSSSDRVMAHRIQLYVALLMADLRRHNELTEAGEFPTILPLVLYTGKGAWRGASDLSELLAPALSGCEPYRPAQRYLLVEEAGAQTRVVLAQSANLAALWFRLQQTEQFEEMDALLERAEARLAGEEHAALREDFTQVMRWLLQRRSNDFTIPAMQDLREVRKMLTEHRVEWWQRWLQEGEQKGLEKGLEKGRDEGRIEGRLQGEARVLQRLLTLRFGPLPERIDSKLSAATEEDLLRWSEAVLKATSLDEVFTH